MENMTDNQIREIINDLASLIMDADSNFKPAYDELIDAIQLSNSLQMPQAKDISLLHFFYRTLGQQCFFNAQKNNQLDESELRKIASFFERGCPFYEESRWWTWEAYLFSMSMLAECSNQIEDGKHYFTLLKDVCDHYLDRLRDDNSRDHRKLFLMNEYLSGRWCTKDLDQAEKLLNDLKRTSSSEAVRDAIPDFEARLIAERLIAQSSTKPNGLFGWLKHK